MSACLQLDIGNSSVKWRLMNGNDIVARDTYRLGEESPQAVLLNCTETLDHLWISSVAAPETEAELAALLEAQWGIDPWFARTEARTGALRNSYEDPGLMGVDRWLAMLGARGRNEGRVCVIDAGSALTIDIVSATGQHEGGYIIPGSSLMERVLLSETGRVRFHETGGYALSPGTSTAQAVRHGIALAQAGAVRLALDVAGSESLDLVFCGGAGEELMQLVGRAGQWVPDLVFEGLAVMAAQR
ncbi:MAG: type III pantothenate kinase [Halioglobus sp.]|nr:type III pantothenate kinase [Halioglobus sp.]